MLVMVWAVLAWLFDPSTVVNTPVLLSYRFTDSQSRTIMATLGHSAPQGRYVMGYSSSTAHININTYKSCPTGTESSAVDKRTHTGMHKCAYAKAHSLSETHLPACRYTHIQKKKTSKRPIMDVTAQRLWMDRFPRSVWNICQQETYTECRLFAPFGENTHYVNDSSFGIEHAQLETVC